MKVKRCKRIICIYILYHFIKRIYKSFQASLFSHAMSYKDIPDKHIRIASDQSKVQSMPKSRAYELLSGLLLFVGIFCRTSKQNKIKFIE